MAVITHLLQTRREAQQCISDEKWRQARQHNSDMHNVPCNIIAEAGEGIASDGKTGGLEIQSLVATANFIAVNYQTRKRN